MDSQYLNSSEGPSFARVKYLEAISGWLIVLRKQDESSQGIDDATKHIEINIIDRDALSSVIIAPQRLPSPITDWSDQREVILLKDGSCRSLSDDGSCSTAGLFVA